MFPYPSGAGLHVGHPEGYTATDIIARYKRMRGFNVLHPMGWDAFGLPAEQYAIKTGQHPAVTTAREHREVQGAAQSASAFPTTGSARSTRPIPAISNGRSGFSCSSTTPGSIRRRTRRSRSRPIAATIPTASRLAYVAEVPVNWCPELGTVLANEEVIDGKSEVGGFPVERRPMRQWMLRITAYAERLIDELDGLDWPESIKELQRNWIGRSEGAEVRFRSSRRRNADRTATTITVFTTRPDTLYGATYMVLAPEHPLVDRLTTRRAAARGRGISRDDRRARATRAHRTGEGKNRRLHRRVRDQSGQRRDAFRSGSPTTC